MISKHSQSVREKRNKINKEEANYLASVKIPDMVAPVDAVAEKRRQASAMKGFLQEQMQTKKQAMRTQEGKFFGLTDEEILLNKDIFKQMGLI